MRLINTSSLELLHVVDSTQETYVVLSHVWGNEEVTFEELSQPASRSKFGFDKIEKTCSLARQQGFDWAWVDTCCIDKTSSAELSEAINSMFTWYRDSQVCFVHLADLEPIPTDMNKRDRRPFLNEHLARCRWFTRGWTLQELIASRNVEFYDQEWNFVGTKSDLEDILSRITNIDSSVLRDSSRLREVPVGRRMSWASMRQTTRKEDVAYCLLGIFDINMPMLYGEGAKAFLRLQDAIAAETNDLSLFAWQCEDSMNDKKEHIKEDEFGIISMPSRFGGIFASSPLDFRHCITIKQHRDRRYYKFTMASDGVQMESDTLSPINIQSSDFLDCYLLDLGCVEVSERTNGKPQWLSIYVIQIGHEFVRLLPDEVVSRSSRVCWAKPYKESRKRKSILIRKRLLPREHTMMKAFLDSQVTVLSRGSFPPQIKRLQMAGYPLALAEEMYDPIGFTFHNPSCHSLQGMVNFDLEIWLDDEVVGNSADWDEVMHCVIICGLEWKEDHLEPWAAIYADHDSLTEDARQLAKEIIDHSLAPEDELLTNSSLRAIHDIMLREYSDVSGNMVQEKMPQSVILRDRWKLSLINETAANIEETKRSGVDWKELKEYVIWLECHGVTE